MADKNVHIVVVTTEAFEEKRLAEEIENLLLLKGIEAQVRIGDFPGVLLVTSSSVDSLKLANTLINLAPVKRRARSIVPLMKWTYLDCLDYTCVFVSVIEDILPRINIDLSGKRVCIRCRFRGFRGEHRAEMLLGEYLRRTFPNLRVSLTNPDVVLLVETVRELCGVYLGRPDSSVLLYRGIT